MPSQPNDWWLSINHDNQLSIFNIGIMENYDHLMREFLWIFHPRFGHHMNSLDHLKGALTCKVSGENLLYEKEWSSTCIHVSSIWRSGDVSGDVTAGGKGWMSFGTTTRSLPKTNIAPALFAVPVNRQVRNYNNELAQNAREKHKINYAYHSNWWLRKVWSNVPGQNAQSHPSHTHVHAQSAVDHCYCRTPSLDQAAGTSSI